jgi:hypothetical protein
MRKEKLHRGTAAALDMFLNSGAQDIVLVAHGPTPRAPAEALRTTLTLAATGGRSAFLETIRIDLMSASH